MAIVSRRGSVFVPATVNGQSFLIRGGTYRNGRVFGRPCPDACDRTLEVMEITFENPDHEKKARELSRRISTRPGGNAYDLGNKPGHKYPRYD